jgi:septal ring factor EnvC (AmiA/AmiB activator)
LPASQPHRRAGRACLLLTALVLLCGLASGPLGAQARREPAAAERELRQARAELEKIAQERRRLEGERGQATVRLRRVEEQLGRSARDLSRLEQSLQQEQQALQELRQRRAGLQANLDQRRQRLARLVRAAYSLGDQAPLKLLLSQDSAAQGQRTLAYYRYAQREHSRQLTAISQSLATLQATEVAITQRSQALESLRQQRSQQLAAIQRDRGERAAVVSELDQRYQDRQQREQALGKDVKALERLLAQLRAAAAKAQAERQAAARRAAQQQQNAPARPGTPTKVPPKVTATAPAPRVGGLSWPASGDLLARFGGRLPDGRTSSGVLIGAAAGAPVTAVADGTVVFSEWMTGYGLILILDHGNGYMSLYAHNESLLRDAGARVSRGEQVARVGSSGGHGRPALYFELRRNGQPVDPSSWLQRR